MTTTPTATNTFTEKDPLETLRVGVRFTKVLQTNEAIVSASWTATTYSGVDPSPNAIITGPATFAGVVVSTKVIGGVAGCVYKLKAIANTTTGRRLVGVGFLPVG